MAEAGQTYLEQLRRRQINPPAPSGGYRRRSAYGRQEVRETGVPLQLQFPTQFEFPELPQPTLGEEEPEPWYRRPAGYAAKGLETIAKPFVWVNEHIEKPWAAMLLLAHQGITPGMQSVEKALAERAPGESWWDTIKTAYEGTELKKGAKFFMEMSMPLWWVFPVSYMNKALGLVGRGAKALGLAKVGGKALKRIKDLPVIRSALRESLKSKAWNAPARMGGAFQDAQGAYMRLFPDDTINAVNKRLLQDITKGKIEPKVLEKLVLTSTYKPGAKKLEVLAMLTGDDTYRALVIKRLPEMAEAVGEGVKSLDDVVGYLGGTLRQHLAALGGKTVPVTTGRTMADAYAFWRAGVLTTPWYVMQNYWEDYFRFMIDTFEPVRFAGFETAFPIGKVHLPRTKNAWALARSRPTMPMELQNTLLLQGMRGDGYNTAAKVIAAAKSGIVDTKAKLAVAKTLTEKKALQATINKWDDLLRQAPEMPSYMKEVAAQVPSDAIMEGALLTTQEHPLTKWTGKLMKKPIELATEAQENVIRALQGKEAAETWAKGRAFRRVEAMKRGIRIPRGQAGDIDSITKAKGWQVFFDQDIKANMKMGKIPSRVAFADDVLPPEVINSLRLGGFTDDQLKALKSQLLVANSSDDVTLAFANIYEAPLSNISQMPKDYVIPTRTWDLYKGEIQRAVLSGDDNAIRTLGKQMKKDSWAHLMDKGEVRDRMMREALDSMTDNKATKEIFDGMSQIYDDMLKGDKEFLEEMGKIFPSDFMERFTATRAPFEAQIIQNRAEMRAAQGLILQKQQALGKSQGDMARFAAEELRPYIDDIYRNTLASSKQFRKATLAMTDRIKELRKAGRTDDLLVEWTNWRAHWLGKDAELVGRIPAKPDVNLLWCNYDLAQAEIWRRPAVEVAKKFGVEQKLNKFQLSTMQMVMESNVDDLMRRSIEAIPNAVNVEQKTLLLEKTEKLAHKLFAGRQDELLKEWEIILNSTNYASARADAMMGNYAVTTDLDTVMSYFVPFWYFPSRSALYYGRTMMQKPYIMSHLTRYLESVKEAKTTPDALVGYFPIHIGDQYYYINPLRPWMGYQMLGYEPLAGMGQPMAQQVMSMFQMFGIGFVPPVSWGLEVANVLSSPQGLQLTRGEMMPLFPQERWLQDLWGATIGTWQPYLPQALFSQTMDKMPDWEKRNLEKEIARWINQNPDLATERHWEYARDVLRDAPTNVEAQNLIKQKIRRMSRYGLVSVAVPLYNRRNEEEIKMRVDRDELIRELLGENADALLERADQIGFSPMMYFNQSQRREIYKAHPEWKPWQGLTRVGIAPAERKMEEQTREYFMTVDYTRNQLQDRLRVADTAFLEGRLSGYQWRVVYEDIQTHMAAVREMLVGDGLAPDKTRVPGRLPLARVTPERVEYFREKFGNSMPPIHPEDVALTYYYSIQPELDPMLGTYDYDTYFARRDAYLDTLPLVVQDYIAEDRMRSRYDSPIEETYRKDREKMQSYLRVRREILAQYPEYQMLMEALRREQDPSVILLLQKRVGKYERMISDIRQQMRLTNAELESLLFRWGYVSSLQNPQTIEWLTK